MSAPAFELNAGIGQKTNLRFCSVVGFVFSLLSSDSFSAREEQLDDRGPKMDEACDVLTFVVARCKVVFDEHGCPEQFAGFAVGSAPTSGQEDSYKRRLASLPVWQIKGERLQG